MHQPKDDDPQPLKDLRASFQVYLQKWLETPPSSSSPIAEEQDASVIMADM